MMRVKAGGEPGLPRSGTEQHQGGGKGSRRRVRRHGGRRDGKREEAMGR